MILKLASPPSLHHPRQWTQKTGGCHCVITHHHGYLESYFMYGVTGLTYLVLVLAVR
jgi:hypothetical protein